VSQGEKIYLRPGEAPPPGVQVYVGPRGGRYYFAPEGHRSGLGRIEVPDDRPWQGLRRETVASRLLASREAIRTSLERERRRPLRRGESEEARTGEMAQLEEALRGVEGELAEHLASGEADWLDLALAAEAGPDDFARRMPLGGKDVGIGIHAVHTSIVDLERSFWTPQQGMHSTRAVYKHGMLPGRFEESHGEMAAWAISEILELGICPEVRYANPGDDNRWGHVMRWLDHAGERGAKAVLAMRYGPARKYKVHDRNLRRDIVRMFVLDVLGDNGDRHFGNWVVHDELRRAFAIDNGFMFSRESPPPDRLEELMATRTLLTLGAYSRDDYDEFRRITSRLAERRDALVSAVMRIYSVPDSFHTTPDDVSRRLQSIERGLQRRIDLLINADWELPDIF
jgi:hypothetical protein